MALFYDFRVDVSADKVLDSGFHFTQGDSRQIFFRIVVMDGSKKFEPEGAERITINFRKADGTVVEGIPELNDGVYQYQLLGNELQFPGRVIGDVKFEYDSGRVSTGMFSFIVDVDTTSDNAVKSTSYISTLEEARQEARTIIGEINTSKDSIKGYSDSAVEASESARMAANDSREYASGDNETSAKHYAEQAEETLEELKEYSNDFTYLFVMYSPNHDGSDATDVPDDNTRYIGIYAGKDKIKPTNPSEYTWSRIRGADGTGSGWEDVSNKPFFNLSSDFVVESDALKIAYELKAKVDGIDGKLDEPLSAKDGEALIFKNGIWQANDIAWDNIEEKPFDNLGDDFTSNEDNLELSDAFWDKVPTKGDTLEHYGIEDGYSISDPNASTLADTDYVPVLTEDGSKKKGVWTLLRDKIWTYIQGLIVNDLTSESTDLPLSAYQGKVLNDEKADKVASAPLFKDKNILFVGDSFGQRREYTEENKVFIDYLADYIGAEIHNVAVSGAGFCIEGKLFISQVQNYSGDKTKITDIIVFGGGNDIRTQKTEAEMQVAIKEFADYVRANYPNAKVQMCLLSTKVGVGSSDPHQEIPKYIEIWRNEGMKNGLIFVENTQYILSQRSDLYTDLIHPNTQGQKKIAKYMISIIGNGVCNVSQSATFEINTGASTTPNIITVEEHQTNGIVRMILLGSSSAATKIVPVTARSNLKSQIANKIGTLSDDNMVWGNRYKTRAPIMTSLRVVKSGETTEYLLPCLCYLGVEGNELLFGYQVCNQTATGDYTVNSIWISEYSCNVEFDVSL